MAKVIFFVLLSAMVAILSPFCRASSEQMNQPQAVASSRTDREKEALASLLLHVLIQRSIAPVYSSYPHWSNLVSKAEIPSQLKKKDTWYRYRGIDSRVPAFGSFFSPSPSDNSDTSKVFRYG